jgi:S1-C subfamily serine protease
MASGMSGGPAYDQYGDVIGINVGVIDPHGEKDKASASGFAFVVPGSAVCGLLGRA